MSMIKIDNLTFSYDTSYDNIFDNVSLLIDTDWKSGLVGRNGRGKTTLLKLLTGKYEYSGKITSSVKFDYFPYAVDNAERLTEDILHEICPLAEDWELMREFSYLDVDADVLWRSFNTLSNGEQTKVLLSALFLNEGHFLLIDEPTNHLDTKAREIVSDYLKKKKNFILVSHDRKFLDNCIDHIISINRNDIDIQAGNFSSWYENFERQRKSELLQNEQLKKEIARLNQSARRTSEWSDKVEASKYDSDVPDRGFVGHKSAKMMKRSKVIETRQQQAIKQKSGLLKNIENAENLKISPLKYHSDTLVTFSGVSVYYEERQVCENISFDIRCGDRIALNGKNGCGKSSLLKIMNGENIKYSGDVHIGSGLMISYVPQNTSHLNGSLSDYARSKNIDESLFKAILRKMDFERVQFEKDISEFSEGQKKKVLIAGSLCEQAHLYVWDEPLNFIDIYSRIQIENLIADFLPTIIFVEHDSLFREKIATKLIQI